MQDIEFDGGIVHIIDTVLTIPENVTATAAAADLSELVDAVTAAGLGETIDSLEEVTVFAPSNEAFEAISDTVAELSEEELAEVLQYHVIDGTVGYSTGLEDGATLETVQGESVTIRIIDGDVYVNDAQVIIADVLVSSGVVHVIDGVLLPDNADATPVAGDDDDDDDDVTVIDGDDVEDEGEDDVDVDDDEDDAAQQDESSAVSDKSGAIGVAALFGAAVALFNY